MENVAGGLGAGLIGLLVAIFLVVLAVLWFLLPFAVFGIKDRLDDQIKATRANAEAINALAAQLHAARPIAPAPPEARELTLAEQIGREQRQ